MKTILKTRFLAMALITLMFCSVRLQAQFQNNDQNQLFARNYNDTVTAIKQMKDFNINYYEGVVYAKLVIKGLNSHCFFELQRSKDGINYESVDNIKGVPGPGSTIDIMYCMKDSNPLESVSYYRVKQLSQDDEKYTNSVIVYNRPETEVAQKISDSSE